MTPDPPLNEAVAYELLDRMKAAKAQGEPVRVSVDEVCWLAANYWPSVTPYSVALERIRASFADGTARVWGWPAELCGPFYEANMRAIEVEQEKGRRLMWRHLGISDPLDDPNPFPRFRLFRWLP